MSTRSQSISDEAVQKATGKAWNEWLTILEQLEAGELSHQEIAEKLQDEHGVSGWWAQTITVEYERSIGRREVGQTSDGAYQVAVSKTLSGSMDDTLAAWEELVAGYDVFDGVAVAGKQVISKTDNWRYWRTGLADGSRINVVIGGKGGGKSLLSINHENLPNSDAVERWRAYWKSFIADL